MVDKLLPHQIEHVEKLVYSLTTYNRALDLSDTGTGKTYSSVAICKIFGWKPFIICPKSVITSWVKVLEYMKCVFYGITNYESLQNCKYFNKDGNKVKATFLIRENLKNNEINTDTDTEDEEKKSYSYKWVSNEIPNDVLFIFDEVHKSKNIKTNNGKILVNLSEIKNTKILLLSATVVDKPKYFILTGYVLGLYDKYNQGKQWIKNVGKNYENPMQGVHKKITDYTSRMKITDMKETLPHNNITAECLEMDNAIEIQAQYEIIKKITEDLKKKENSSNALAKLIYARQRIEMLKIPTFIKLTEELIKNNKSVVIFVNFTDTLMNLSDKLNTKCLIYGEQSLQERDKNINDFVNDEARICICNIKAGSCGISLHDCVGKFPRVSLISPTWSAQDLIQVLGRIYRAKTKTTVFQRIIFCKGTVEDGISNCIKDKIGNIAMLNDGYMDSYQIKGLIENKENKDNINNDINDYDENFNNLFTKLSKMYEKKDMLNKELNIINKEIELTEQLIQSHFN
jgi:superfamily II DNA or RNA helicase